jgi:hypothetical protein
MMDAQARNTSTLRAREHGHVVCMIKSSQNITAAAMIMRMSPEPSIDDGKRIHQELRDLVETTVVQQAQLCGEAASRG